MFRKLLILSLIIFACTGIQAQQDDVFGNASEIYFSFKADDAAQLNMLSRIISVDRVGPGQTAYAYANRKSWEQFSTLGIEYTLLQHPGTLTRPRMLQDVNIRDIDAWDFYPSYDAYVDMMYQYEEDYPGLCEVFSIGTTNEGRELLVARISDNVGQDESEPEFLYTATIHGDETTGYVLMLRLIDYLLSNYGSNQRITDMVDDIDIFINPLANPDGSYHVGNSNIYGAQRYNSMGVDLNRNYPDPEDGPHPDGNPWQTETIHFMNFAEERDFVMSANFHGGEEVLNYPWDTWSTLAADNDWWIYVCREYADTVHENAIPGYLTAFNNGITNGYQWYTISGGRQDYMNYFHQCREVTAEISNIKLLPANQLENHWDYNYRSLLNYIEQVRYGLRGRITDSATGEAIEAEVYVMGHESDSSWTYSSLPAGNYHRLLEEGSYSVRFKKAGYYTQIHDVEISRGEATVLDIELVNAFSSVADPEQESIRIYPNPAQGNFVRVENRDGFEHAGIYSPDGRLLQKSTLNGTSGIIDISKLKAGIYIIRLDKDGRTAESKFVRK